jgi:hypothetical protein
MSELIDLIAILAIPFGIPVVAIVTGHRRKMAKLQMQSANGASRQVEERIAAMEDRIRVLERIITENRSSMTLAHEIDALRSDTAPPVAARASASR